MAAAVVAEGPLAVVVVARPFVVAVAVAVVGAVLEIVLTPCCIAVNGLIVVNALVRCVSRAFQACQQSVSIA